MFPWSDPDTLSTYKRNNPYGNWHNKKNLSISNNIKETEKLIANSTFVTNNFITRDQLTSFDQLCVNKLNLTRSTSVIDWWKATNQFCSIVGEL